MTLLDFELPQFARSSWVSDAARETWKPRLEAIVRAWPRIEALSVAADLRRSALVFVDAERLAELAPELARLGLATLALGYLDGRNYASSRGEPIAGAFPMGANVQAQAGVGRLRDLAELEAAAARDDAHALEASLGVPGCCARAHRERWIELGLSDVTWPMALASAEPDGRLVRVDGHFTANVLWRSLGVRAVPHLPCRFDCAATRALGEALLGLARTHGEAEVAGWLEEVLRWPVEWSMLHGIAELKTPILKLSTNTDATAQKHVVQLVGDRFPREGATGLSFPFAAPEKLRVSGSRAFASGLANPTGAADGEAGR